MPTMWPVTLPRCPQRQGYTRSLPNMALRTNMDTGPAKVRYRGGNSPQTVEATYVLNDAQRDIMEDFMMSSTKQGAICFEWPDPESGVYVLARFVGGDSALTFSPVAPGYWSAQIKLEFWRDAPTGA